MSRRKMMLAIALLLAADGVGRAAGGAEADSRHVAGASVDQIDVKARPLALDRRNPARRTVGRLTYMGGLVLSSRHPGFGGISGLLWDDRCQRLLAVSDEGHWLLIEPEEIDDRLEGVARSWMAPLGRPGGQKVRGKGEVDAEALARDHDGYIWVFFEQIHRAERYKMIDACAPETLASRPDRTWMLPHASGWAVNGGAEAAARMGQQLAYLSETATSVPGSHDRQGVIASPDGGPARSFSYLVPKGFSPTDMAPLNGDGADGRMLILHRRVAFPGGFSALLAEATLSAGSDHSVRPREIARLSGPLVVDNMEALAVREEGERRFVYLMSDDNRNSFQRTLLLKFELQSSRPNK